LLRSIAAITSWYGEGRMASLPIYPAEAISMASQADVRRIALSLPGTEEAPNHFAFEVLHKGKLKGYAWVWMERVNPRKARVPQPNVIAVRVANLYDKDFLLALDPAKFFTEPHYDGFPAVLVRLPAVTARELRPILTEAWRCLAPKDPAPKGKTGRGRGAGPRRRSRG
jgi:hypothetical protein